MIILLPVNNITGVDIKPNCFPIVLITWNIISLVMTCHFLIEDHIPGRTYNNFSKVKFSKENHTLSTNLGIKVIQISIDDTYRITVECQYQSLCSVWEGINKLLFWLDDMVSEIYGLLSDLWDYCIRPFDQPWWSN